ncbi:hypothetical protein [Roseiflexus castenholzii]|uniref:hypothetical protein n=1 Tax=Roseiflexus castenholzii TaxID=120962 RepID=UPI003C7AC7D8
MHPDHLSDLSLDDIPTATPVLVCVVTHPTDFERIRTEGWYRIPVDRARVSLTVGYLAFYQTAAFGAERWAVRSIAAVRSVDLAYRYELIPDEPRHPRAAMRYYRFALGPLLRLPLAIPSGRLRRVTFIPTTFGQLLTARDIVDLWQPPTAPVWSDVWGAGVNARWKTSVEG